MTFEGVGMPDNEAQNAIDLLNDLVAKAKKAGADAADAVAVAGISLKRYLSIYIGRKYRYSENIFRP